MTRVAVAKAKKQLCRLISAVSESHEPVLIVGHRNKAVIVSEEHWRSIQETVYLLSVPKMRESIKVGLKTPVRKCSKDLF